MSKQIDTMRELLDNYLQEMIDARNVQTRADALTMLREHLLNMNYLAEFEGKVAALDKLEKESE